MVYGTEFCMFSVVYGKNKKLKMDDANTEEQNRPNIRIQIHNNLINNEANEQMEIGDNEENEEGEIIEATEEQGENITEKNDALNLRDKVCKTKPCNKGT